MNEFERYGSLHQEILALLINSRIGLETAKNEIEKGVSIWTSNDMQAEVFNNPEVPQHIKDQLQQHRKFAVAFLNFLETTVDSGETIEELISQRFYG